MRAVFGDDKGRLDRLRGLLTNLTEVVNDSSRLGKLALFGPRWLERSRGWREAMAPVERAVLDEVRRRRAEGESGRRDAVSMLIEARSEDGSPLSEKDLRDELLTLLTDGPTSSSLAWVFERLLRHPEKLARLQEELLAGEGGRFVPERFLERRAAVPTWIPFGGGARRCLAASYAEQEMKRVLRTVLEEVELQPVESRAERVTRGAIAFSPAQHGLVMAKPRTPAYA